eukprot:TRINITY_DN7564_c0_g1_i1.p1 TRINITY_DN7564_c0_g1~~TRINITY_DN7564_c0_g1_i1.p1  ORF type:complete len:515 (+),score=87.47 TRINITY_DN7564_c0_g1_i1:143-1687(+)
MQLTTKALMLVGVASFVMGMVVRKEFGSGDTNEAPCPVISRPPPPSHSSPPPPPPPKVKASPDPSPEANRKNEENTKTHEPWNHPDDVVMGLARYEHDFSASPSWPDAMKMFVGTLRHVGYKGRIVMFVHPLMTSDSPPANLLATKKYLLSKNVEIIGVETAPCQFPFKPVDIHQEIRKLCSADYPMLQLEWARFAIGRDWLKKNPTTGWSLMTDVRDTFFQRTPFADLGPPTGNQTFVYEEYYGDPTRTIATGKKIGIDTSHWFAKMATKCYGKDNYEAYKGKPMLCSGQILGTGTGSVKMLDGYIDEMRANGKKNPTCVPPELPDQTLLNYMVYHNQLDITPVPYGKGAIMTIGGACTSNTGKKGLRDQLDFDGDGYILDSRGKRVPVVHQWDRCGNWMELWIRKFVASFGELPLGARWERMASAVNNGIADSVPVVKADLSSNNWVECAAENETCKCSTSVRFGSVKIDKWEAVDLSGKQQDVSCLNENSGGLFKDPAPGKHKICQCKRSL